MKIIQYTKFTLIVPIVISLIVTFVLIKLHGVMVDLETDGLIIKSIIPVRIAWFFSKPGIIGLLFFISCGFIIITEKLLKTNRSKLIAQVIFLVCWILGGGLITLCLMMSIFD